MANELNNYFQRLKNRNYPDNLQSVGQSLPPIIALSPPTGDTQAAKDVHDILAASIKKLRKQKKLDRVSFSPHVFDPDTLDNVFTMFGLNPFEDGQSGIETIDYAQAQPYIAIHFLDSFSAEANVVTELDMNAKFMETAVDHAKNNREGREYPDRPEAAIEDLTITYEEGMLTGPFNDLGIAQIEYTLKFFDPSLMQKQPYRHLMGLGVPMLLRFGWRNLGGKDYIEEIKFQNYNYTFGIDEMGVATLKFQAYAQGVGVYVYSQLGAYSNRDAAGSRFTRVFDIYNARLEAEADFAEALDEKSLARYRESAESAELLDNESFASGFKKIFEDGGEKEEEDSDLSTAYRHNIDLCIQRLDEISTANPLNQYTFASPLMSRLQKKVGHKNPITAVTLGALINEFVVRDLIENSTKTIDTVIVGNFNELAGVYAGHSMLNFPIFTDDIKSWLLDKKNSNVGVTTHDFFTHIMAHHVSNYNHYISERPGPFVRPQPHVFTRTITIGKRRLAVMFFIDKAADIPLADRYAGLSSQQRLQLQKTQVPSLTLGRSKSPIRTVNMTLINDPNLQSVIVQENLNREKGSQLQSVMGEIAGNTRFRAAEPALARLQMEGDIDLLGVPNLPIYQILALDFKTGFWDGLYITSAISHNLSAGVFTTNIHVRYLHLTAIPSVIAGLQNDVVESEAKRILDMQEKRADALRRIAEAPTPEEAAVETSVVAGFGERRPGGFAPGSREN